MKKSLLAFFFVYLSLPWSAASTTSVSDPNYLLEKVDRFLNNPSFDQSLICGTKSDYSYAPQKCELNCGADSCISSCQEQVGSTLSKIVSDCTPDSVFIYSDRNDIEEITRFDFEKNAGNMARLFLNNLGDFLFYNLNVNIEKVENSTYILNRDTPDAKVVPSMNIFANLRIENVSLQPKIIISVIQAPAVGQVVRFRVLDQTWFLLKDYK